MNVAECVARLYARLLLFYPRDFQRRFARDMCADFRDAYADACRGGTSTVALFLIRSCVDLATSLISQWRSTESFVIWGTSVCVAASIWAGALLVAALEWPHGPVTARFVAQLAIAFVAGSTLTIGIALRKHANHWSG